MKPVSAITHRTDAEWPADHPLRRGALVLSQRQAERRAAYLICSRVGEPRRPAPPDDQDVTAACSKCGSAVVHRSSAPAKPARICLKCWEGLQ